MEDSTQEGLAATGGTGELVVSLEALGRGDLAVAGGKGANLGELIRGGFPVPPGFVVTTAAYDRFVSDNALQEVISRALGEEPQEAAGSTIRGAFEGARIPPEVEGAILAAYRQPGPAPVAVRSSATAEDLPEAAFAGQQDTFLNVDGEAMLLDAVRRCWASLWSDRAIAYRSRQGVEQQTVKLAVVVQQMVLADAAGVMFTANPVTGARDEIVIDASPGLGEAVVSGLVTPDHFILRKGRRGWSIVEQSPGRREVVVRPLPGGGTERVETAGGESAPTPALSPRRLRLLARIGTEIENHFGSPQDIEWAWAGGKAFIVQARPITALPESQPRPDRVEQAAARMFAEMVPVRPYPLDMTTWVPALSAAATMPIFGLLGVEAPSIGDLFVEEEGVVVRFKGRPSLHVTPAVLLVPLRLLRLILRYRPTRWRSDPVRLRALSRTHALEERTGNLEGLTVSGLLAVARAALSLLLPLTGEPRRRYLPQTFLAAGLLRIMLGLVGRADLFGALLFSGVENKTAEANKALEDLASRIRSDPDLSAAFAGHEASELPSILQEQPPGRDFLREFSDFMGRYGHRETLIIGPSQPAWKDAPEVVLGILKGLAPAAPRPEPARPPWEAARDEVLSRPLLRIPPVRWAFLRLLGTARCILQIREDTHFDAMLVLPVLRRALLESGRRLVSVGALDEPGDIFHLKLSEIERVGRAWPPSPQVQAEVKALALRRKAKRAALESTPLVGAGLLALAEPKGDVLLRGTPGSPGVAVGAVRVIRSEADFGTLRPGEVLVAPYTNPAWTPLFERAAAVVVDSGSAISHAAIVAREYGIPAVMGTTYGTQALADGQRVRVDGQRGLVLAAAPEGGPGSARVG